MRAGTKERLCKRPHVDIVLGLKRPFAQIMLFAVTLAAQAYGPPIRWLNARAAVRPNTDMSAFNCRDRPTSTASMAGNPFAMGWGPFATVSLLFWLWYLAR